ncbi:MULTISPECIES: hypothetical protein [unclassified Bradyrhizobium]|uniref:DUF6894 family protein n=1 Tax=unclassified Bradyrhizobium TaxID=2631580 RepID=UPI0024796CB4|nr:MULTISPECIES: hypothetical protein [unclassified Bradyrhizobium]WGR68302.1 hypothetical protein MTX24_22965 [Bradyrhizobium sp. ISRA426]WGR80357.1 hypothetical protein MTX21_08080 [Bradyrhizobium sp. ISRA430]WGR83542.1 hypothetical protein MTX25_22645 [Bradyrhizobium sp. ISRA432]
MATAEFQLMPRFYFDYHDCSGTIVDNGGYDLSDGLAARRLAWESLGQAILDGASRNVLGELAIEVRDAAGPVLRVSAIIEVEKP